jgi:hypothetical protein
VRVTDVAGTVLDFATDSKGNPLGVGWVGTEDVPKSGTTACACSVREVYITQGLADPSLYYPFTTTARSFGVNVHLTNVPSGATVRVQVAGGPGQGAQASRISGSNTDGQWSTGASAFSSATSEGPEDVTVTIKQGNTTYTSDTVQRIYPHDQSTLLYSYAQSGASFGGRFVSSSLAAGAPGRQVSFQTTFVTLVKGRQIVLKLGGGSAASPGNFGALDLDTNSSWGQYACYATNGVPNFADELQHGACTPYSIGQQVATQTGAQTGQIDGGNGGLTKRIGSSPNNWTSPANPPPAGDPRWVDTLLVGPLSFEALNGNSTTPVVGFGNFYITAYSRDAGSGLKPGEVRGIFWDRANPSGAYSTTCPDPSGICLDSIALMPWNG